MSETILTPRTRTKQKVERPKLHKVILLNDDYTPREFVVMVLKAVFRMSEDQARRVMMTAHRRGACVVAVYTQDVAESKATEATELGRRKTGVITRRPLHALGLGAAWAALVHVGGMALGAGFRLDPLALVVQAAGGAVAALIVFWIARALRR